MATMMAASLALAKDKSKGYFCSDLKSAQNQILI
jgi:hypothetical protein